MTSRKELLNEMRTDRSWGTTHEFFDLLQTAAREGDEAFKEVVDAYRERGARFLGGETVALGILTRYCVVADHRSRTDEERCHLVGCTLDEVYSREEECGPAMRAFVRYRETSLQTRGSHIVEPPIRYFGFL